MLEAARARHVPSSHASSVSEGHRIRLGSERVSDEQASERLALPPGERRASVSQSDHSEQTGRFSDKSGRMSTTSVALRWLDICTGVLDMRIRAIAFTYIAACAPQLEETTT